MEVCVGRVIAISNLKGGIGKTTTVVNVGAGLALRGNRVLLVDTDAQGNLAMALGIQPKRTLYDVLVDNTPIASCIVSARPQLDLLAADATLLGAQPHIAKRPDWSRVLSQALRPIVSEYDIIIIDSAGSLTPLNINALVSASDVIAPTTVEHFSIKSLELLFSQINRVKGNSGSVRMIVPTMFDPRMRQSIEILENLHQRYGALVAPPVRVNVRLSEAPAQGQTIYEYDPRSRGAADYARLVEHIATTFGIRANASAQSTPTQPTPLGAQPILPNTQPIIPNTQPPVCPNCGRPLQYAVLAGYRIAYCDHCKYKTQTLLQSPRR
jgi:chromosome partitioning protein